MRLHPLLATAALAAAGLAMPVTPADAVANPPVDVVLRIAVDQFGTPTFSATYNPAYWECHVFVSNEVGWNCYETWLNQEQRPVYHACAEMVVQATTTGGAVRGEVSCRDRDGISRTLTTRDVIGYGSASAQGPLGRAAAVRCTAWGVFGQDAPVNPYQVVCGDPPSLPLLPVAAPAARS